MNFVIRHIDALIPFTIGLLFLADGLRRTIAGRPGRRLVHAGAALVLVALGYFGTSRSRAALGQPWTPMSEAGRFSVVLPAERTHSESHDPTPYGPVHTHKWHAGVDHHRVSYIFRYSDLPQDAEYQDPQATLDATEKVLAGMPGSRVTGTRPLSLAGHPGRQLDGLSGGTEMRTHVYVTRTRLYALIRTAPRGEAPADDPFFTSFTLDAR